MMAWQSRHVARNLQIVAMRDAGESKGEIAAKSGVTVERVRQILWYADNLARWRKKHGADTPVPIETQDVPPLKTR